MLEGDAFALRDGHDLICVIMGRYYVTTCFQNGDGDKVSDTFLVEPQLEVTICSLHPGERSSGVTSSVHCGVTFLDICQ